MTEPRPMTDKELRYCRRTVQRARERMMPAARAYWKETLGKPEGPSEEHPWLILAPSTTKGTEMYRQYYWLEHGDKEAFLQACEAGDTQAIDRLLDVLLAMVWLIKQDYEFVNAAYRRALHRLHRNGGLNNEQMERHLAYEMRELHIKEYHSMFDPQEENHKRAVERARGQRQYIIDTFGLIPPECSTPTGTRATLPNDLLTKLARIHELPAAFAELWQKAPDEFLSAMLYFPEKLLPVEHRREALPTDITDTLPCYRMVEADRNRPEWYFCTWEGASHCQYYSPLIVAADVSFYAVEDEWGNIYWNRC